MLEILSMSEPRPIDVLLAKYSESHLNHTNEIIHFVCVPAIVFSLLGLIWSLQPLAALGVVLLSLAYYVRLSIPFAAGMLVMSLPVSYTHLTLPTILLV